VAGVDLKDLIEELLCPGDGEPVRTMGGLVEHGDHYTVQALPNDVVEVRSVGTELEGLDLHARNPSLEQGAVLLVEAGLLVEQWEDHAGGYLLVSQESIAAE
jgi:hypothetical protein